jgi:hypothetical protein
MRRYRPALLLISALSPVITSADTASAPAQSGAPTFKFASALNRIDRKVSDLMGPERQLVLRQIAEAAVLSDYCAVINLDQRKFKQEFDALVAGDPKLKPAEHRQFEAKLMTYFGVYVGLLVAEGTDRRGEFCALAEDALAAHKPISRFWLSTDLERTPASP